MDPVSIILPASGLLGGLILGYVARRNFFCTLSAFEQHWYGGNSDGLRTWALAAALAILGTQALVLTGIIDVSDSFYLTTSFDWLGAVIGGIAFGVGMALVGTCGFGALLRLGGGSLKSLMALLVLGLFAISTIRGLIALGRVGFVEQFRIDFGFAGDQSLPAIASAFLGTDMRAGFALAIAGGLCWWALRDENYRRQVEQIVTAATIAGVIVFGWIVTSLCASISFQPVQIESASFVTPVADTLLQFIFVLGVGPDYGVGLVLGTVLGAAIAAHSTDNVRWEACDDARELRRHILGAACMGVGGVLALGCTIGQGMSAVSLLTVSAPIVMISIAVGARLGLAWMLEGSVLSAIRPWSL